MQDNIKFYNKEDDLNLENNLIYSNLEKYLKYFILEDDFKYLFKWNTTSNMLVNERQPQIIRRCSMIAAHFT